MVIDKIYRDLFKKFDSDDSGSISFGEFKDLSKYMGLEMNEEKLLKMFALADTNKNNYIEYEEFSKAILLIKIQIGKETLRELGLTTRDLVIFGLSTLIFLLFALIFIFFGIFAFSKADGFSAVVSSLLPLGAGFVAMTRRIELNEEIEKVKQYISEFIRKLSRN